MSLEMCLASLIFLDYMKAIPVKKVKENRNAYDRLLHNNKTTPH